MALIILRRGSTEEAVEQWQQLLIGLHLLTDVADGRFGEKTEAATKQYQISKGLNPDGEVGAKTYAKAIEDGLPVVIDDPDFPPKPTFSPLLSLAERQALFESFTYTPDPTPDNPERIKCESAWLNENKGLNWWHLGGSGQSAMSPTMYAALKEAKLSSKFLNFG